ncbi:MAG: GMP/IMP nucleotidase [Pseudomonadota bacterium]
MHAEATQRTTSAPLLDWSKIDTVILDMDGTLIDLNYDNHVWNDLVPVAYAEAANLSLTQAKQNLHEHMAEIHGTIQFYNFDYWSNYCGINMVAIHELVTEMIAYRSGVLEFLEWLNDSGRQTIIATNAHRDSVVIKNRFTNIEAVVPKLVSSHDYGYPKEDPRFWASLQHQHPYTPSHALFVDDNEPVLDAAALAGINHLLCVSEPDSDRPLRTNLSYPSFNCFSEIYDPCLSPKPATT